MKDLSTYLNEGRRLSDLKGKRVGKIEVGGYNYHPQDRNELKNLIRKLIKERGNNADLNDIDTGKITDMEQLFYGSNFSKFNGDISLWDVSNVKNMRNMFYRSSFNGDISRWDVRNVENMGYMFCGSSFNGDISRWDVRNVENMTSMFYNSEFNGNLNNWKVNTVYMLHIFDFSPLKNNPPKWYIKP